MSDETKELYVHQIDYEVLLKILSNVTYVSRFCTYNMPTKADKYAENSIELINTLDEYIGGEEDWRVSKESDVNFSITDGIINIGDWVVNGTKSCICLPKINSIILIPDDESRFRGAKEPTKILHLVNCVAVTPLLVRLTDEPIEGEENKFNLGMTLEVMIPTEKPTE